MSLDISKSYPENLIILKILVQTEKNITKLMPMVQELYTSTVNGCIKFLANVISRSDTSYGRGLLAHRRQFKAFFLLSAFQIVQNRPP